MKPTAANGKYQILAEINMIPFIDIALVLLIIFMVMTPFLVRSQIRVNLPDGKSADTKNYDTKTVEVQVMRNGGIYMDKLLVRPDVLVEALRKRLHDPKQQPLLIEADKDVPFQYVVTVLDAGREVGATKLGVCVSGPTEHKSK